MFGEERYCTKKGWRLPVWLDGLLKNFCFQLVTRRVCNAAVPRGSDAGIAARG